MSVIQDFPCPRCQKSFSRKYILDNHLKRKKQCEPSLKTIIEKKKSTDVVKEKSKCDECGREFAYKNNLYRHKKHYCQKNEATSELTESHEPEEDMERNQPQPPPPVVETDTSDELTYLRRKILELEKAQQEFKQIQHNQESKISQLKVTPHQNVLNVVCIGNNENYLDMLSSQMGNFDQALEYVKECALSSLSGDCKLIQKIYKTSDRYPFSYTDKTGHLISYLDENKCQIVDTHGTKLGKKLAHNLQNSYLRGVNFLINQSLDQHKCPNKFLDEHDVQSWHKHIYDLSDSKYQKKLIDKLDIQVS